MRGGRQLAKPDVGRPLDGRVRATLFHCLSAPDFSQRNSDCEFASRTNGFQSFASTRTLTNTFSWPAQKAAASRYRSAVTSAPVAPGAAPVFANRYVPLPVGTAPVLAQPARTTRKVRKILFM